MHTERLIVKTQERVAQLTRSVVRHASVAPALGRVPSEHISEVYGHVVQNFPVAAGDLPIQGMVFQDSVLSLHGENGYRDGFGPYDFTMLLPSARPLSFQFPKPLRSVTKLAYFDGTFNMSKPSSFATPTIHSGEEGEQLMASHFDISKVDLEGNVYVRTGVPFTRIEENLTLENVLDIPDPKQRARHMQEVASTMLKASAVLFEMSIYPKTYSVQVGVR